MRNPRVAARYAKSIVGLAIEKNQLEEVYKDMTYLNAICKASKEFVAVLRSPVINPDKKEKILASITGGHLGPVTMAYITLLIRKAREENLPEIITAVITQYNELKGIHKVKLTTAEPVSNELKEEMIAKIKAETPLQKIELELETKPDIIGGFVLEFNNNLIDASIERDLRDIKKQFGQNIYVRQIR